MITPRAFLFASPGFAINFVLAIILLLEALRDPGLPVGSECCGWGYENYENYRLLGLIMVGWLVGASAAAFRARQEVVALVTVYSAPFVVAGLSWAVEAVVP